MQIFFVPWRHRTHTQKSNLMGRKKRRGRRERGGGRIYSGITDFLCVHTQKNHNRRFDIKRFELKKTNNFDLCVIELPTVLKKSVTEQKQLNNLKEL